MKKKNYYEKEIIISFFFFKQTFAMSAHILMMAWFHVPLARLVITKTKYHPKVAKDVLKILPHGGEVPKVSKNVNVSTYLIYLKMTFPKNWHWEMKSS